MFVYDIESLGIESTAVILSAAIVYFDVSKNPSYQELLDNTLFVKFDSKEQVNKYGRTVSKSTLEWWDNQPDYSKQISFYPSDKDVSAIEGINTIKSYIASKPNAEKNIVWVRGSLDQLATDSLTTKLDVEPIFRYSLYRDVRTAVDLLYGSKNGYVDINHPEFNRDMVIKHTPYHDVCLDAMMLMYGIPIDKGKHDE